MEARDSYRSAEHWYRIGFTELRSQVAPHLDNGPLFGHNAQPSSILITRIGTNTPL
jgi:hypothetical protein